MSSNITPKEWSVTREAPLDSIFLALAMLYEQLGNVDAALSVYNMLLKRNSKCVRALSNRSIILSMKSQDEKAYMDAHKAVSLNPWDRNAIRARATVQMLAGKYEGALKDFQKALEAAEWDSFTCMLAHMLFLKMGLHEEAGDLLQNAIESRIKTKEWPFQLLQYWHKDLSMADLIAMANSGKSRLIDCRAFLGFSLALSSNPQEGKPDLQFAYNARAGTPLVRALALRGLKMLHAENADGIAFRNEKADRTTGMDWMG